MVTSRAAALLDSLSGRERELEQPRRRNLFSREHQRDVDSPPAGLGALKGVPNSLLVVGLVALMAVAFLGWKLLARPVPLEQRMPEITSNDVDSAASMVRSSGGPDGSGPNGTGTDAAMKSSDTPAVDPLSGTPGAAPIATERITVHVAGAVASPGVVDLPGTSRVVDAVAAAGGLRPDADPDRLNLAAGLADGMRVVVPVRGQEPPGELPIEAPATVGSPGGTSGGGSSTSGPETGLVNVNRASDEELQKLPGVGPATAAAIIAKREKDGAFKSVDSLIEVRGIGEAKLEGMRDLVAVG